MSGLACTRRSRPHRSDRLAPTIAPIPAIFIRRWCPREASATVEKCLGWVFEPVVAVADPTPERIGELINAATVGAAEENLLLNPGPGPRCRPS